MSRLPTALRKRFLLYSKKPAFKQKVLLARARLYEFLDDTDKPYIAFSGGKDSLVCLHLTREIMHYVPAVYFDADCAYPTVTALLSTTENLIRFKTSETFLDTIKRVGLHSEDIERETMRTTVYEPIQRLLNTYKFDGVIYGLRAEESKSRRRHAFQRGAIFRYKDVKVHQGILACQPIFDWNYSDVWSYIVANDIIYCKEYDTLWDKPEREQRISYWAGESNRNYGRFARLKYQHPALFAKLIKAVPEVRQYL